MSKLLNYTKNSVNFRELANYALLNSDQDTIKYVQKFGQNEDVDTATSPEDIWATGGTKTYISTGETVNIASTSINDTAAGTGARTVVITGIDEDYNEITDFITLNGTSNVVTTNSYIEIFRIVVYQAGSLEHNEGTISATTTGTATLLATVEAETGITQQCHYTIPAGYTGFMVTESLSSYKADGSGERQAEITLMVKAAGDTSWIKTSVRGLMSNTITKNWDVPLVIPEKTSIKYQATAATNNTSVSVQYELVLVKNTELL